MTTSTPTQRQVSGLQLHELTSTATDSEIQPVLTLSTHVFATTPLDPNTHISLPFWRSRLSDPRATILYVTSATNSDFEPERPLGFFFTHPRTQDELGFEALHIWLAGVDERARGAGIFPMLLERTVKIAKGFGYEYLTVRTVPVRFQRMYGLLKATGWEVVGWTEREIGESVLMKLKL